MQYFLYEFSHNDTAAPQNKLYEGFEPRTTLYMMGYSVQAVVDLPHPGPQQQLEDEGDPQLPQQHVVVAPLQVGRLIYNHLT